MYVILLTIKKLYPKLELEISDLLLPATVLLPSLDNIFFASSHKRTSDSDFCGTSGGWLTAAHSPPTPTKSQAFLPSSSTHPSVPGVQKKSLPGAGWVFLTRGKREVKAPARCEATACREAAGGALRGDAVQREVMLQLAREKYRAAQ